MGDDHHRFAGLAAGVLQQLEDALAGDIVQRAGGLVAQQQLGIFGQRPGDGHPLLFAAGKLGGKVVHPVAQTHLPQGLTGVQRLPGDLRGQLHVFQRRQVLHQVVELEHEAHVKPPVLGEPPGIVSGDLLAVQQNGARGAAVHASQHIQNGGLASAGGAHDDAELPLLDGKGNAVGGVNFLLAHGVTFDNVLKFDKTHGKTTSKQQIDLIHRHFISYRLS